MPELGWKYGYAAALGVMVLVDVYVFYRLRKSKWL
jgi:magnesium transporter